MSPRVTRRQDYSYDRGYTTMTFLFRYRLSTDGRSCIDIDECEDYQDICIGNCRNEPGSYKCTCPQGYTLSANERSCQDIDECDSPDGPCRNQHCFNTRGGFKCVDTSCPPDYEPDGSLSSKRCKLKPSARHCANAQDVECLRRPVSISFNFIALISDLRVVVTGPSQLGIDLFTMQSARYYYYARSSMILILAPIGIIR